MKEYVPQQTSKWFTKQINNYGCYFFSIIYFICKYLDKVIKPSQIMAIYEKAVEQKIMTFSCYVNNPGDLGDLILKELGSDLQCYFVGWDKNGSKVIRPSYNNALPHETVTNVLVEWKTKGGERKTGGHFVCGEYNPDSRLKIVDKCIGERYFQIGE